MSAQPTAPADLLARADAWAIADHPYTRHLQRTLDWLLELDPDAPADLKLAAILHDFERAYPDPHSPWPVVDAWDQPAYRRWHQDRSANLVHAWLLQEGADPALAARVEALVRVHEDGGPTTAEDLLQAADSLSFLEVMGDAVRAWVATGQASAAHAEAKVRYMHDRIRYVPARELAGPLLARALDDEAA